MILTNIKDYGFQKKAIEDLYNKLWIAGNRGDLVKGGTGTGKTFVICGLLKRLNEEQKLTTPEGSINPFPVLIIGPASAEIQWHRALEAHGLLTKSLYLSYAKLRGDIGEKMFIDWSTVIINNQELIKPEWKFFMAPRVIIFDESQNLRRDSTQTAVARAIPYDKWPMTKVIHASATAHQTVQDARAFVENAGVITPFNALPCDTHTSQHVLNSIAHPRPPAQLNQAAMARMRKYLTNYITELKGVKFDYPAITTCKLVEFPTEESRDRYHKAYELWLQWLAEHEKRGGPSSEWGERMARMLKFRQQAEFERAPIIAKMAFDAVASKSVLVASNFVDTNRAVWIHLVKHLGFDRRKIAFVVGKQTMMERQSNIDRFNAGEADIMILALRAGGVALSLHHNHPQHGRPRYCIIPPTWSAIDLVQLLGRAHRLDSISQTEQDIIWFKDTIEEEVAARVQLKTKCLAAAVESREQWHGMFSKSPSEQLDDFLREKEELTEAEEQLTGEGLENQ